jgi:PhnB protein
MKSQVLQPIPYLLFDGNCLEAMEFYAAALGGEITNRMSVHDFPGAPEPVSGEPVRMMHVRLALPGGGFLYAGDCREDGPVPDLGSVHLALNFETVEEASRVFETLADGGEVEMPLVDSMWGEKFGMFKDKFGLSWMMNAGIR